MNKNNLLFKFTRERREVEYKKIVTVYNAIVSHSWKRILLKTQGNQKLITESIKVDDFGESFKIDDNKVIILEIHNWKIV